MPTAKKVRQVQDLEAFLSGASIVIGTSSSGLSVAQVEALRRALKQSGAGYRVVKNRLALRAAEGLGHESLARVLQGPMALVAGRGDPMQPVRALTAYVRTARIDVSLTGALLDGRILSPAEIEALATMPAREVLLGQLLGGLQGALRGLVTVLDAHMNGLVTVLEQRRRQLEERN